MRILSFICVIIVMALNMVPCADAHEHAEESTTIISTPLTDVSHGTPIEDACTPFCHCACCASSVVVKLIATLPDPFPVTQRMAILHFEQSSIDVSLSVWQPPKLV